MHRQASGERGLLQRIGLGARLFRRDVDRNPVVAALQERFQPRLAEGLLAVNHDTHWNTLPEVQAVKRATSNHRNVSDYWVPAGMTALLLSRGLRLLRRSDRARLLDVSDLGRAVAKHLGENLLGVLAQ